MTTSRTYSILIRGLVQGVGFRPFVYRLAMHMGLSGTVENGVDGVRITVRLNGTVLLDDFLEQLRREAPPASRIWEVEWWEEEDKAEAKAKAKAEAVEEGFRIVPSREDAAGITQVSPDIAVCADCLADMKHQPHRLDYPFINCTNCGPRFTIITDLPYDRERTTMREFEMCPQCRSEYEDIRDRRFHAQPVACKVCGPHYTLWQGEERTDDLQEVLAGTAGILLAGGIVAVKGMGGYFLACDAMCEEAVARLRRSKKREGKPFAVMFRDMETVRNFARVSAEEESELMSWRRPIVILEAGVRALAPSVSMGFPTVGAMLPYMPFHYLLFEKLDLPALVLTSGNLTDEPIVINDEEAISKLGSVTDGVLTYNRRIHNRVDDSVVHFVRGRRRVLRRSRGFAPAPVQMPFPVDNILATGAELVNTFCIGKEDQAIMSQHIGDLKNYETYAFFTESVERLTRLFRVEPSLVACDLHPDYLSTRFARETGLPLLEVQHHHAHVAAVMAEHDLTGQVIGISFDGTGMGDDGHIWGGEFLVCDLAGYRRYSHLQYVPMPGGDKAVWQPWRMALAYLYKIYGERMQDIHLPVVEQAAKDGTLEPVITMIRQGINSPLTSSAGRLFDAVAALTGICRETTFHAEAPMRLEAAVTRGETGVYPWEQEGGISMLPALRAIVEDIGKGVAPGVIATRFHNTLTEMICRVTEQIREETGLEKVILSGGTFQNRILLATTEERLEQSGFEVLRPLEFPVNDGGIALGQLAVAGYRMMNDERRTMNDER